MPGPFHRILATIALLSLCLAAPAAAQGYRGYAEAVVARFGDTVQARPDLEAYLDAQASAYRRAKGRSALAADDLMRLAARAQAADMMAQGRSSHRSRKGHGFDARFAAFAVEGLVYPARGENAASDRRKGAADQAKARRLFASWIESSGHRRNLMRRDYAYVSTGVIQRGKELWAVQIYWAEPKLETPLFQ